MILKVARAKPMFNNYKHDSRKFKDGLKKKKTTSFASVLENTIKFKATGN